MLHIPRMEQCQAHTDCADDAGIVDGTFANLHKVIPRDRGERAEVQKRSQRENIENYAALCPSKRH